MNILISGPNGGVEPFAVHSQRLTIGRGPDNELCLPAPLVPSEAAVLERNGDAWEVEALALSGLQVGENSLRRRQRMRLEHGVELRIFPYTLVVELEVAEEESPETLRRKLDVQMSDFIQKTHAELLDRLGAQPLARTGRRVEDTDLLELEQLIDRIIEHLGLTRETNHELVGHIAGHCVRTELIYALSSSDAQSARPVESWSRLMSAVPDREAQLRRAAKHLEKELRLHDEQDYTKQADKVDSGFWPYWQQLVGNIPLTFRQYFATRFLKKEIKDIVFGYGPLEDLLRLPTISEIMVVDKDHIYVEKKGVVENSGRRFVSNEVSESIIKRIVSNVGREINRASPLVDARLRDGSRVNAVLEPIAVRGPCLTIRRFSHRKLLVDDLVKWNALTETVADFLQAAVISRKNIIVSGGTGTGKTTLLNCLSDFIPDKERIVTIEDTVELRLSKEHVVQLEKKEKNIEGAGEYTIRDLVRNGLRMRPDRVVVGECRGPEALDMLQAMNTGHDGSLTTIHANTASDVILRLEVLVQMAGEKLPVESIHRQIGSAVDVIVQLRRMARGRRCVSQVTEVVGVDPRRGSVVLRDLFLLDDDGDADARLLPTGHLPSFMGELLEKGLLNLETFYR
jgi:Flp pilus assembly CpaF family ATPase